MTKTEEPDFYIQIALFVSIVNLAMIITNYVFFGIVGLIGGFIMLIVNEIVELKDEMERPRGKRSRS